MTKSKKPAAAKSSSSQKSAGSASSGSSNSTSTASTKKVAGAAATMNAKTSGTATGTTKKVATKGSHQQSHPSTSSSSHSKQSLHNNQSKSSKGDTLPPTSIKKEKERENEMNAEGVIDIEAPDEAVVEVSALDDFEFADDEGSEDILREEGVLDDLGGMAHDDQEDSDLEPAAAVGGDDEDDVVPLTEDAWVRTGGRGTGSKGGGRRSARGVSASEDEAEGSLLDREERSSHVGLGGISLSSSLSSAVASDDEVLLTDAEGRRYCRVKDCDQLSVVDIYCRYHYLLFWRKIQVRKKILSEGKLERYIEELTARYPDKYLEMLRKDLRSEKDFMNAISEMEIDDSTADNEFEDETQNYLDEVRGMSSEVGASRDDDEF